MPDVHTDPGKTERIAELERHASRKGAGRPFWFRVPAATGEREA